MEEKKTTRQYKRTLRSTVGTGMSALAGGNGRRFYVLEHRDSSKYHRAGESQKIIIDQIELGCNPDCQVRFDQETWGVVSRRHAAIEREGNRWKLIHLSTTNSTFLNGRKIESEWYLENGDEIQLAANGPRLGFIAPEGKQGLVSSIKMTERLELFRKQALKPYKRAIAAMFAILVIAGCSAGYLLYQQGATINTLEEKVISLLEDKDAKQKLIDDLEKKFVEDSIARAKDMANIKKRGGTKIITVEGDQKLKDAIAAAKPSVFYVTTTVYLTMDGARQRVKSHGGTGFLMEDGRFVTARHMVEPWLFDLGPEQRAFALSNTSPSNFSIEAHISIINMNGDRHSFTDKDFIVERSGDTDIDVPLVVNGDSVTLKGKIGISNNKSLGNDWAYTRISSKGTIKDGKAISASLKQATKAHVLGFPQGLGSFDGEKIVEPIYNSVSISRNGLNDARCIMVTQGIDHGNSGGPVFVMDKGNLLVIGIVSRGDTESDVYNHLIPMCNLK